MSSTVSGHLPIIPDGSAPPWGQALATDADRAMAALSEQINVLMQRVAALETQAADHESRITTLEP